MEGWIRVPRKLMEDGWLENHPRLALWLYLWLRASYKKHKTTINYNRNGSVVTEEVDLEPGQLLFGRYKAGEAIGLKDGRVRTLISQFKKQGHIRVSSNNRYSIISIVDWERSQNDGATAKANPSSVDPDVTTTIAPPLDRVSTTYNNGNKGNTGNDDDDNFTEFIDLLNDQLKKYNYQIERELLIKKLRKSYQSYGLEEVYKTFAIVIERIIDGKEVKEPISYGVQILKNRAAEKSE